MGQKRTREGDNSSRKKDKRCFVQGHWTNKDNALPFGSQGIMITVDGSTGNKGLSEALNVFEEAWESLMEARKASATGGQTEAQEREEIVQDTAENDNVEAIQPAGSLEEGCVKEESCTPTTECQDGNDKTKCENDNAKNDNQKPQGEKEDDSPEPENFDSLISSEVKDLKQNKKKPFVPFDTGIKTCLFLKMPLVTDSTPGPCEVVEHVLREAKKTKTLRFRFCARILPFTHICKPTIEDITSATQKAVSNCPECGEKAPPTTVAVLYEHRAAPKNTDRTKLIDEVIAHVKRPPHTVKLKGAAKTICVQVIRNACGVAILNDYHDLSRYNVREVCKSDE